MNCQQAQTIGPHKHKQHNYYKMIITMKSLEGPLI